MKKALVILLAMAPLLAFSQDRTKTEDPRGGRATQGTPGDRGSATPGDRGSVAPGARGGMAAGQRGGMAGVPGQNTATALHIEFVLADQSGRPSLRMTKESNVRGLVEQPELQEELTDLASRTFTNAPELFNFVGALGWDFKTQFVIDSKGQRSTHFMFSKMVKLDPVMVTGRKPAGAANEGRQGGAATPARGAAGTPPDRDGRTQERK